MDGSQGHDLRVAGCRLPALPFDLSVDADVPPDRPGVGDACLVGRWESTGASGYQTLDDGSVAQLSGSAGAILTIEQDGTTTMDYSDSEPLRLTLASGEMSAQVSGSIVSILAVAEDGTVSEKLVTNGSTYVLSASGVEDVRRPTVFSAASQYSCTDDTATFSDSEGLQMTYERR